MNKYSSAPCQHPGRPRSQNAGPGISREAMLFSVVNLDERNNKREAELLRLKLPSESSGRCLGSRQVCRGLLQTPGPHACCSQELILSLQAVYQRLRSCVTCSALLQRQDWRCSRWHCSATNFSTHSRAPQCFHRVLIGMGEFYQAWVGNWLARYTVCL